MRLFLFALVISAPFLKAIKSSNGPILKQKIGKNGTLWAGRKVFGPRTLEFWAPKSDPFSGNLEPHFRNENHWDDYWLWFQFRISAINFSHTNFHVRRQKMHHVVNSSQMDYLLCKLKRVVQNWKNLWWLFVWSCVLIVKINFWGHHFSSKISKLLLVVIVLL